MPSRIEMMVSSGSDMRQLAGDQLGGAREPHSIDRADRGSEYWTLAECMQWICTREIERVLSIPAPASADALVCAMMKYRPGGAITFEKNGATSIELRLPDSMGVPAEHALDELMKKCR